MRRTWLLATTWLTGGLSKRNRGVGKLGRAYGGRPISMRQLDQANPWTTLHREEKFTCSFFSVRSDTVQFGAGLPRMYNSIRMKTIGVTIAPIDDEGCTTLIGQYRYVLDRFTWELPAGGCRLDQAPVEAAKIELSEETGYRLPTGSDCSTAPCRPDQLTGGPNVL
jgi:NUDIX domain